MKVVNICKEPLSYTSYGCITNIMLHCQASNKNMLAIVKSDIGMNSILIFTESKKKKKKHPVI